MKGSPGLLVAGFRSVDLCVARSEVHFVGRRADATMVRLEQS